MDYLYAQPLEHYISLVAGTSSLPGAAVYYLWLGVPFRTADAGVYKITVIVSGKRTNPTLTMIGAILAIIGIIITAIAIKRKVGPNMGELNQTSTAP